jgi:hypothetical protein
VLLKTGRDMRSKWPSSSDSMARIMTAALPKALNKRMTDLLRKLNSRPSSMTTITIYYWINRCNISSTKIVNKIAEKTQSSHKARGKVRVKARKNWKVRSRMVSRSNKTE